MRNRLFSRSGLRRWSTWSSSRADEECLGGVDGDSLVGVIIGVVGEDLGGQTEGGTRTEPESSYV